MQNTKLIPVFTLGLSMAIVAACGGAKQKEGVEPTEQPPAVIADTGRTNESEASEVTPTVPEEPSPDTAIEEPANAPEETSKPIDEEQTEEDVDTQPKPAQKQAETKKAKPETKTKAEKPPQTKTFKGKGPKRVALNKKGKMARVNLDHWGHQEAEIKCGSCHHYGMKSCGSKGCHMAGGDAAPSPKDAYHGRCIPCHKKKKVASGCNSCHR